MSRTSELVTEAFDIRPPFSSISYEINEGRKDTVAEQRRLRLWSRIQTVSSWFIISGHEAGSGGFHEAWQS